MKKTRIIIILLIIFNFFLAIRWLFDNNLLFHTDIARDLYLIKDIWDNKHFTLIGARAGGLSGWFHGPLWLYINLPAYIIGKGNPVIIAWFWFILHLLTCYLVFKIAKKIFDNNIAVFSLLIYSVITILDVHGYINPQGALITFPMFFYFYWKYKKTNSIRDLTISLFLLGLIIQFQIAFGGPILLLTIIDNILISIKHKKIINLFAFLILIIPLSTYILFELRHNFIQIKSISQLFNNSSSLNIFEKIKSIPFYVWLSLAVFFVKKRNLATNLFLFFYFGFWTLTLFYNGTIMNYYYLPFLPILIITVISLLYEQNKIIFTIVITVTLIFNWQKTIKDNLNYSKDVNRQDWSTWNSIKSAANWTLDNCGPDSGYFVYTADMYGYNLKYAMDFQSHQKNISMSPNKKAKITCLLIGPDVKENPFGSDNWKSGDIKISGKLVDSIKYQNGIVIEKYELNEKDIQIEPNPFLIKDTFFR